MMRILLFFSFLFSVIIAEAQQIYPLRNNPGLVPLITASSNDFTDRIISRRLAAGDSIEDDEKEMLQVLTFNFQQELRSGSLLYNDSMSRYIRDIAAILLKDDTATFNKLRFYVTKEARVNAYSLATGDIVVTIGMLAQVDNEAQLAYILAHEITHYRKKHSIKRVRNSEEKTIANDNNPNSWKAYYNFTKENEFEADLEGLKLYRKSPWALKEALRSFDVLEYSRFPFDDRPFDTTFFNRDYLKIPPGYFLRKIDPIFSDDNRNDSYSTHPNVRKRRMAIMTAIDTMQKDSGKLSVVAGNPFRSLREKSRYELCLLHFRNQGYAAAIYSAYLLLLDHPDDGRLKMLIGQSLFEVAAMNTQRYTSDLRSYDDNVFRVENFSVEIERLRTRSRYSSESYLSKPGQQQQVYRILSKLSNDEVTVLALAYNWDLHTKFPDNKITSRMCDSLFSMLVNEYNLHLSYFSKQSPDEVLAALRADSLKRASETKETGETKYTRLEKFRLQSEKERFLKFAFVEQLKDSAFENRWRYFTDHRRPKSESSSLYSYSYKTNLDKKYSGEAVKKIIVIPVDYTRYHQPERKKRTKTDPAGSVVSAEAFDKAVQAEASAQGLQTVNYTATQTDLFDEHALIRQWYDVRDPLGNNDYGFPVYDQKRVDSLADAAGTSLVLFTSCEAKYYRRITHPGRFITLGILFPPSLVYGLFPDQRIEVNAALLNIRTGETLALKAASFKRKKESKALEIFFSNFFEPISKGEKTKS